MHLRQGGRHDDRRQDAQAGRGVHRDRRRASASKATSVSDNAAEPSVLRTFTPDPGGDGQRRSQSPKLFPFDDRRTATSPATARYESPTKVEPDARRLLQRRSTQGRGPGRPDRLPAADGDRLPAARSTSASGSDSASDADATPTPSTVQGLRDAASSRRLDGHLHRTSTTHVTMTLKDWPGADWGARPPGAERGRRTSSRRPARDFDPGLPFGTYAVCCVDDSAEPDRYKTYTVRQHEHRPERTTRRAADGRPRATDWNTTTARDEPPCAVREERGFTLPELLITMRSR